ncbi:MAG: endonuclease III [Clostridiales bacterium]|nr:endonuclease III [Clostridiales bacterium]
MAKLTKKQVAELVPALEALYPDAGCALHFDSVFHLLVAVMLSAQTTDKSVNQVTPTLFAKYPEAADIAAADRADLENILRHIGMYRTKAKNLQALCQVLADEYGGEVPQDYDKLTALPGVGRKTANVVLSVGFGEQRIAVDTHVFRLANRIGLTAEPDVLKTELSLMKALPYDHWSTMHHALIWHGRQVCNARNPKCEDCGIRALCKKNGLTKK